MVRRNRWDDEYGWDLWAAFGFVSALIVSILMIAACVALVLWVT